MSAGMTIADAVQQVLFQVYGVRLDVTNGVESDSFHSKSDKFKEVVMEMNLVLQELQKEADWVWLRDRLELGIASNDGGIQEFVLPDDIYKVCSNYGDAVRLHRAGNPFPMQIPICTPWTGNRFSKRLYDNNGELNTVDLEQQAFVLGNDLTFKRMWNAYEIGGLLETDVIRRFEPLHICDSSCSSDCAKAYSDKVFTEVPDPLWITTRTATKRAAKDPSAADQVQVLTDEAAKLMSAMRENHAMHTACEYYETSPLGYISVY